MRSTFDTGHNICDVTTYAAAGVVPDAASLMHGKPTLVLGPVGPVLNTGAIGGFLGVNRLDVGAGVRGSFLSGRYVMQ